ncbi:hypothetical protein ABZ023_35210 [Streptomyces sp. NPDC006367]|uniref:hypothetical protein n=1 Tax=Streptomyces sp. NPDC006367 TaxID=3156759 RepID=UPI0033BBF281
MLAHLTDDILTHLVQEALEHQTLRDLPILIETAAAAGLGAPRKTRPGLEALTKDLETSEQIQLWRALVKHWSWPPPAPDAVTRALKAGDSRYTSLLLLVEECASHSAWEWQHLKPLTERLSEDVKARPERQAGASSPTGPLPHSSPTGIPWPQPMPAPRWRPSSTSPFPPETRWPPSMPPVPVWPPRCSAV